ncbi:mannosyl-glycoprotein endo-beta-N-acetylglucosaminidase [Ranunculus cassubicifolius]
MESLLDQEPSLQESSSSAMEAIDQEPSFDPSKPSLPISYPIKTLQSLSSLSQSYFNSFHYPFQKSSVPLPLPSSSALIPRPKLLVCHDMAGGYTDDDKWIQGGRNEEAYAIWHWHLIDVFVYFSHNLVTIPPPCWINAAHTHGVKVLGTFITEWEEGRAICNTLLSTKESAQMYAERLSELAVALGFDGWLVNMEVQLDVGQIPNLKEFVNHLTQTMHSAMPGSLVIWYDSVTIDGDLSWQNQLNESNKPFFDLCDGIFVNYTWAEDYPKLSAAVAGDRKFDVYMGIDVFGRNTYGGGQWTTNVALDVIKKDDVSAAVFAPGWVYETKQPPDFQTAQNRWWGLIEKSWGVHRYYPKLLPFYSNFDQGHGYHYSVNGRQVSGGPWCNISCQSFQPVLENSASSSPTDTIQFMVDFKEASFSGGANIAFKGTLEEGSHFTTRIFRGELPLDNLPIHITYSVKCVGRSMLGLSLEFSSETNEKFSILIAHNKINQLANNFDKIVVPNQPTLSTTESGWITQESSISMKGYTLTQINMVCFLSTREPRKFKSLGASDFSASLGHITIRNSAQNLEFPPSSSWKVEGQDIEWSPGNSGTKMLSVKLVWDLKGDDQYFPSYNVYARKQVKRKDGVMEQVEEYIGVARVRAFYVSEYLVPPEISSLKFIIQVCGVDGTCQELDSSSPGLLIAARVKMEGDSVQRKTSSCCCFL